MRKQDSWLCVCGVAAAVVFGALSGTPRCAAQTPAAGTAPAPVTMEAVGEVAGERLWEEAALWRSMSSVELLGLLSRARFGLRPPGSAAVREAMAGRLPRLWEAAGPDDFSAVRTLMDLDQAVGTPREAAAVRFAAWSSRTRPWENAGAADLRRLYHAADRMGLVQTRSAITEAALARVRAGGLWADPATPALISSLRDAFAAAPDREALGEALAAHFVDREGVLASLSLAEASRLRMAGEALGVDPATRAGWLRAWMRASANWREMDSGDLAELLRQLDAASTHADVTEARAAAADRAWRKASDDARWLARSLRSDLWERAAPRLSAEQKAALVRTLTQRVEADERLLSRLDRPGMDRLLRLAHGLGVAEARVDGWRPRWIVASARWRGEPPHIYARLLETVTDQSGDAAAEAQRVIVTEAVERAKRDPAWLARGVERGSGRLIAAVYHSLISRSEALALKPTLAALLNGVETYAWCAPELAGPGRADGRRLIAAWYGAPRLPRDGVAADDLTAVIHEGLASGWLEPRPTTLALVSWHERGRGELDPWRTYLEDRIAGSEAGGEQRTQWLLGRAYVDEIAAPDPAVLRGRRWLEQALAEAATDEARRELYVMLYLQLATAQRFDEAASLIESVKDRFTDEAEQAQWARLAVMTPAFEASAQAHADGLRRRHEASRASGRRAILERRLAEAEHDAARAEEARTLRDVIDRLRDNASDGNGNR